MEERNETGPAPTPIAREQAKQARPHEDLISEILAYGLKTEREHAAAKEIHKLYGLLEAERLHNLRLNEAWQAKIDALGLAISDAGYTWTPEMRKAYEKMPNTTLSRVAGSGLSQAEEAAKQHQIEYRIMEEL